MCALVPGRVTAVCHEEEHQGDCHTQTHQTGFPKCSLTATNALSKSSLQIRLLSGTVQETTYPPRSLSHKILLTGTGTAQKKNKGFVNFSRAFFCHKQIACFICKAGQTSSSQNIGKSHVSHDWKTFPTAALPSQSQPHPYHTQKHVQNHAKAWICALQHDSSSASPTEAPQRTWVMPRSILPHHTHSFYFLAEAVHQFTNNECGQRICFLVLAKPIKNWPHHIFLVNKILFLIFSLILRTNKEIWVSDVMLMQK